MAYVYFPLLSNHDIYVGSTPDLKTRVAQHQQESVQSTTANLPAILKSYVAVDSLSQVRSLELYFKTASGKAFANKRFFTKTV